MLEPFEGEDFILDGLRWDRIVKGFESYDISGRCI